VFAVGEGQVGDKGLENQYTIDLAASDWAVKPLVEGFEAGYVYAGADSGLLYFATTLDAPRGRVIAIDPLQRERARWKEVVPQGADAIGMTSTSVTLVGHRLIVTTLHDAHSRVSVCGLDGRRVRDVSLPGPGTATGFEGSATDRVTFYKFNDLITPPTIYRYDLATGVSTVFRAPQVRFASGDFEEKQVFYPGKDGTKIPMTIAYRKGLALDGTNPAILYGYGGFGVSLLPTFNASRVRGWRWAASTRWPTCAAAASTARNGTARACGTTARPRSTTSWPPRSGWSRRSTRPRRGSRSRADRTAACWWARASRSAPNCSAPWSRRSA
jgi:prolyl oligopeptidase PreP (S9A serine peptidase family)